MPRKDNLSLYRKKRDFKKTAEPKGIKAKSDTGFSYLIQKHAATRLHYDFRLELDGTLKSWAVTRGPSLDPNDKRLAVEVEDHPLAYGSFEGIIPKGQYGGGTVMLWDSGTWEPIGDPRPQLKKGKLTFLLHGKRMKGEWTLVRMKDRDEKRHNWLLIKHNDKYIRPGDGDYLLEKHKTSVVSGRTMEKIAKDADKTWQSKEAANKPAAKMPAAKPKPAVPARKARAAKLPEFIPPQLATLSAGMPEGEGWVHEIKFDGYRMISRFDGRDVTMLSRNGKDWTDAFAPVARSLAKLPAKSAILDGEVVAVNDAGVSSFKKLQEALSTGKTDKLYYYVFDLLYLDGEDLTSLPLLERKARLEPLLKKLRSSRILYSEHMSDQDHHFLQQACRLKLEGVVSKRADAPYRPGRSTIWLKSKCHQRQEFVIGGFVLPSNNSPGVGALLLGVYDGKDLVHTGRVGTGFTHAVSASLRKKLEALKQDKSPFADRLPASRNVRWVKPKLVCEVEFTEWTPDGALRHPSFQGLREDKPAIDVHADIPVEVPKAAALKSAHKPKKTSSNAKVRIGGVNFSHPDRILFPGHDMTKQMLAEYYYEAADHIIPYIKDRPLSIIRCPDGINKPCFFQRNTGPGLEHVHEVKVQGKTELHRYLMIKDIRGLLSLLQWNALELHPWQSRADKIDQPDRLIFDLDPDPGVTWEQLKEAAQEIRERMRELKLESFLKVTGGKGLHVTVPIVRKYGFDQIKPFTRELALSMAHDHPDRFTANMSKAVRKGRIFVDYLRNEKGATAVAPFSIRAREEAHVAVPISWQELARASAMPTFSTEDALARLKRKNDPWEEFYTIRQSLPPAIGRLFPPPRKSA